VATAEHQSKIVLGVSGGIACYKAVELVRLLVKSGFDVQVVMTHGAMEFVTPLTGMEETNTSLQRTFPARGHCGK
jgi:phosphopantothenoylcysteine decarboxylase/phosphopantothenate--cysteine ligase